MPRKSRRRAVTRHHSESANSQPSVDPGAQEFFFRYPGARRRQTPRAPEDAPRRDLSDTFLQFDLSLSVRRRHAPKTYKKPSIQELANDDDWRVTFGRVFGLSVDAFYSKYVP